MCLCKTKLNHSADTLLGSTLTRTNSSLQQNMGVVLTTMVIYWLVLIKLVLGCVLSRVILHLLLQY